MSTLRICLFGKFEASRQGRPVPGLDLRKTQELLCYLLLFRRQPHPREALASQLWCNQPTAQSKKNLRQTLWHLQSALDSAPNQAADPSILLTEPDWININPAGELWLDVAEFEQAFAQVQTVPGEGLTPAQAETLDRAAQLYQADLLVGWYQDWCLPERERLQATYLSLLHKLMSYSENYGEYERGLQYGGRVLRLDRAHERTHRRLMRMYYLQGDRTAALRQYEHCVAALKEELDVAPTERTRLLHDQIRADHLSATGATTPRAEAMPPALLPQMLARLKRFQAVLTGLERHIAEDIRSVEQLLNQPPR